MTDTRNVFFQKNYFSKNPRPAQSRGTLVAIFPLIGSAHRERGNVKIMKLFGLGKNHYGK